MDSYWILENKDRKQKGRLVINYAGRPFLLSQDKNHQTGIQTFIGQIREDYFIDHRELSLVPGWPKNQ